MRKRVISLSLLTVIFSVMIWTFYINWPKNNDQQTETILTSTEFLEMNKTGEETTVYVEEKEQPIQDEDGNTNTSHNHEYRDEQVLGEETEHKEVIVYDEHAGHDHQMNESEVLKVNSAAKDFQLKTLDGKTVRLSDLKGKKVLLNFWATWCPPCREEMPELQKYYEEAKKNNVVFLGVNITDQEFGTKSVREFVDYYGLTFPILLDETGDVSIDYEILSIPTTFVINEQGMIVKQINGPVNLEMLHQLLGE